MVTSRLYPPVLFALVCWLALPGAFLFDDHSLFVNPTVTTPAGFSNLLHWSQPRPLTYLTFWADHRLWGPSSAGFHFTNVLIHAASAWLLFKLLGSLAQSPVPQIAAVFFLLHPLTAEPLYYVFARSSSLAVMLTLAAFMVWLKDHRWAAVGLFAAALAAKEEVAAFPLALALVEYSRQRLRNSLPAIAAMGLLSVAAGFRVIASTRFIAGAGSGFDAGVSPWQYFLQQGQALPNYLWRIVLPIRMSIDPADPSPDLWLGLAGWAAILIAATLLVKTRGLQLDRPVLWCLLGLLAILPSSSILPAADAVAYRRLYFPMVFWCVSVAMIARRWRWWAAIAGFWLAITNFNPSMFSSERAAWTEASSLAPEKIRPLIQLARISEPPEAIALLERAKKIAPQNPEPASQLGRAHLSGGDAAKALAEFGKALALDPSNPRHMQNRGVALLVLGQNESARADFERALAADPCLGAARLNLEKLGAVVAPMPPSCRDAATDGK